MYLIINKLMFIVILYEQKKFVVSIDLGLWVTLRSGGSSV